MKASRFPLLLPLVSLALLAPASALAQKTKGGSGDSNPVGPIVIPGGDVTETYVINQPGSYVLGGNRSMTDATRHAIVITAPDVTLDLRGYSVGFPVLPAGAVAGVFAETPENVVVRDGTIANAHIGASAAVGKGVTFTRLRVTGCTIGLYSSSAATLFEDCQVLDSTQYGIAAWSPGSVIRECSVDVLNGTGIKTVNSQIIDSRVRGGIVGADLTEASSMVNTHVSGASHGGISIGTSCVVRSCHVISNRGSGIGVSGTGSMIIDTTILATQPQGDLPNAGISAGYFFLLANTRIVGSAEHVKGSFVDGGGNTFW